MQIRILCSLLIVFQVTYGQVGGTPDISRAFAFLDSLLEEDNYTVEFLSFEYPQDIQDITLRFQKSITDKKEWFQEYYSKNYKSGEGMPYHENFGITYEEYLKIKDMKKTPPKVSVSSTAQLKANRNEDIFSFKALAKGLGLLEALKIDFKNEVITFFNDTLSFESEINTPATTPLGEWHGYSWKKQTSNTADDDDLNFDSLVYEMKEISFGRIHANNKTLLRIQYKKVNKGTVEGNIDMVCYLK